MCNDVAEHIQVLLLANQEYTFCLTSISHTGPRVSEGSEILNILAICSPNCEKYKI